MSPPAGRCRGLEGPEHNTAMETWRFGRLSSASQRGAQKHAS